jgi:hypothetical protein
MSSSPRKPLPDEVVPVRGEVPSAYREAQQMLCETTVDLFTDPDQLSWKYGIKRVDDQILNQSPVGEKLVLYSELNEIADKFERGCICAATAEVEVFFAKKAVCEGVVSVV